MTFPLIYSDFQRILFCSYYHIMFIIVILLLYWYYRYVANMFVLSYPERGTIESIKSYNLTLLWSFNFMITGTSLSIVQWLYDDFCSPPCLEGEWMGEERWKQETQTAGWHVTWLSQLSHQHPERLWEVLLQCCG